MRYAHIKALEDGDLREFADELNDNLCGVGLSMRTDWIIIWNWRRKDCYRLIWEL